MIDAETLDKGAWEEPDPFHLTQQEIEDLAHHAIDCGSKEYQARGDEIFCLKCQKVIIHDD